MEETKLFLITYLAALLGVVPPGLVNMSVAETCLKYGKKQGIFVAIGASSVVILQAFIAILLAKYIFDNPFIRNILLRTGLVIFLLLAVYFFIKGQRKRKGRKIVTLSVGGNKNVLKGMAVSALNIFPIPYFCALGTALNVSGDVSYQFVQIFLFIVAAAAGSFTTLYFYVSFFGKIKDEAAYFSRYSNYFMAALMLLLVLITIFRILYR